MTAKKLFLFWILLLCQLVCAQQDSIVLQEVVVSDVHLKNFSKSQSVRVLNDSIIEKNAASLTSLLNYNSTIYFKQNGLGMVSSPSFRGTTAQQTAVIWNGININSQLTGQTDFNTIATNGFENITVRAGGGSTMYGSGAIGGTIHLNNELSFKNQFRNALLLRYGSFNTFGGDYKMQLSDGNYSANSSISRNSSDNDYEYPDTNGKKNQNGQFYNTSMNLSMGYKLSAFHSLKLYSQFYESERHFSGTIASDSDDKYADLNTRNMIEWRFAKTRLTSSLKAAFLSEQYKYFANYKLDDFETAKAETVIAKYDLGYAISSKFEIDANIDFTQTKGKGSNIGNQVRNVGAAAVMMKYQFSKNWESAWSFKKEMSNTYQSPLLFSFGIDGAVTKFYSIKFNASRNFRMPTFNDLYWQPGGNPELKAENSYQVEFGQELHNKDFSFTATLYYNAIRDLLQWRPIGGVWSPENVGKVNAYGAEFLLNWKKKTGSHIFDLNATYAYTVSKDAATGYQLTFVPYHKITGSLAYNYRKIGFEYQYLFNGAVFTLADNETILKEYLVSNVALHYQPVAAFSLGFQVLNVWDEAYQSVPARPLPGRNYQINLTFKI